MGVTEAKPPRGHPRTTTPKNKVGEREYSMRQQVGTDN